MQIRTLIAAAAVGVVAAGALAPAVAAPKPKPFAGSYTVTLSPDPVINAWSSSGEQNCFTLNPSSVDKRNLKVPRAGKLQLVLDSPQEHALSDWDMYVLDKAGEQLGVSNGGTAHEEIVLKLKKATEITVAVCNLTGSPQGKVTYKLL